LNSSQAAVAESKRAKLCEEYAQEIERMKAEADQRIKAGKPSGNNS
jgi:hypothetical protein